MFRMAIIPHPIFGRQNALKWQQVRFAPYVDGSPRKWVFRSPSVDRCLHYIAIALLKFKLRRSLDATKLP